MLETGLAYMKQLTLEEVGTHSANREGAMLILSNVHKLFELMGSEGYNPNLIKCLAVECSPHKIQGERDANARLWERADGLLAVSNKNHLNFFTLMGSHTTAVFRLMKFGGCVLDKRFADSHGKLQSGKLFDAEPSLKIPCEKGLM